MFYSIFSSEDGPTLGTKKQRTGDEPVNPVAFNCETQPRPYDVSTQLNNSSTHVTMSSNVHTSTSTPLSTIPNTSSILQSTSSSQISSVPTFVPANVLQSFPKASEYPKMLSHDNQSPAEHCNTVYTCQTTKPTAHVQTDDDILEFIKIYLSPFLATEKNETLDSSVFDELFNINSISEKMDNFDNLSIKQRLPLC